MSGAKILDVSNIGASIKDTTEDDIPVSLLNQINKLEETLEQIMQAVSYAQTLLFREIGPNLDGRLPSMIKNTHNLAVNNSGEIFAIVKAMEKAGIATAEELAEIKAVEFDVPLQKMQEETLEKVREAIEEENLQESAKNFGIVAPTFEETSIISKIR